MSKEDRGQLAGIQTAGIAPAVVSVDAVAIYDPKDGRVVHLHHAIRFEGVKASSPDTLRKRAVEAANQMGRETEKLAVLHVPNFEPSGDMYRVDLKRQRLVGEQLGDRWDNDDGQVPIEAPLRDRN